ncbi:MAG: Extracellular ligand-binding receptor [Amycolatopsis sp.]|jgi:branched-chain amino acid transport system substrate-binding protein|uniref:ABC transporter substrate-binding protein n=1 Tax=Amycolatopsis sp. TaxID=37632 RepID=UPI00260A5C69|nr:ABC transporter substrate-binding protein [Amycolatopsis sp.]MCU1683947.1 Extracellular ligand-binding receptor [Amycolatopsis sp.]
MKTRSKFAALCVALLFITAACGSGGKPSANSGSSAGTPVVIGVVGSFTGAAASASGVFQPAINAWAKSVNDAGGIHGSQVNLIVKDVGSTGGPAGLTAVKELIGQDHVVAVISADVSQETWLPYASAHNVPVIVGGVGDSAGPGRFQTSASEIAAGYEIAREAKTAGPSFGFGFCVEVPDCGSLADVLKAFAKDLGGVQVGFVAQLSAAQPDFTAFCQQLKNSGVASYYIADANAVISRVIDDCAAQGVRAVPLLAGANGTASWVTDPAYEGALVNDFDAPYFDTANPAIKVYRDAMAKYAPDISAAVGSDTFPLLAWVAGQAIVTAASKVDGPITSASLTKALYTFRDETLGGLSVPLTFDESHPSISTCTFEWTISHGQRVVLNGGKARCAPETALAPFLPKAG